MGELAMKELRHLVVTAAVAAALQQIEAVGRTGAALTIPTSEAIARVVSYALAEWRDDLRIDEPISAWKRAADDVIQQLRHPEWIELALASRSVDGRTPIDWLAYDRQLQGLA